VIAYPFITDLEAVLKKYPKETWGAYQNRLKIGGVKITIDGSPQGKTAYFTTPYLTGGPGGEKKWTGELTFPEEVVTKAVKVVYDMGVPLNLHANGDGAIDAFLRAHEKAAAGDLSKERNITMIHSQFVRKDQLDKYVTYKIRRRSIRCILLFCGGAHREPRPRAGGVHQPDARRHRQGAGADEPH
jgi:predicted amidohydrolase YtcJ